MSLLVIPFFRTPVNSQNTKGSQTLLESARQHFHQLESNSIQYSWKMTILVIYKILGLFVNILTADRKYSFFNGKNLEQSIQMQSSEKQKTLPDFFALFLKSTSSFEHFKKIDPHSLFVSETTDIERRG